jgi:CxxC motif-containing protein
MIKKLTCIECPIGCEVEVTLEDGKVVSVKGNSCPRGKLYAEAEVVCPKRVVTSTVRAENGQIIPVKTDRPVRKDAIFEVMAKINGTVCKLPVAIGDVLVENICDDANLVVTGV